MIGTPLRRTRSLPDATILQKAQAEERFEPTSKAGPFDPVLVSDRFDRGPSLQPNVESWRAFPHPIHGRPTLIDTRGEAARPRRLTPGGLRLDPLRVAGDRVRFVVVGDSGLEANAERAAPDEVARALRAAMAERPTHFVVHVGDMIYPHGPVGRSDPRFRERVLDRYAGEWPLFLALGNHEYGDETGAASPESIPAMARASGKNCHFPARYYAFEVKADGFSVDFFVLDTTTLFVDSGQRRWLDAALGASSATRKIVVGHHPFRSDGYHQDSEYLRTVLLPTMIRHGVSDYLSGHEHDLQLHPGRAGVPTQLVSGGGAEMRATGPSSSPSFSARALGFAVVELDRESSAHQLRTLKDGALDPVPLHARVIRPETGDFGARSPR